MLNDRLFFKCCVFLNAQMKQIPVPSCSQVDVWDSMSDKETRFCLDHISELAVRLYHAQNSSVACSSHDLRNRTSVNLYKCLGIIFKLAKRFPETHLQSFDVNAWSLAWWPKQATFRIIDFKSPGAVSYHEQLTQVQRFFKIDPEKDYTDDDIAKLASNSLFYETPGDKMSGYITPFRCGGPADTRYYSMLMEDPAIKYRMGYRGITEDSTTLDKFKILYEDSPGTDNVPDDASYVLPKPFKQLRLVQLLAYKSFFHSFSLKEVRTVNDFHISVSDIESNIRKTLNFVTLDFILIKPPNNIG